MNRIIQRAWYNNLLLCHNQRMLHHSPRSILRPISLISHNRLLLLLGIRHKHIKAMEDLHSNYSNRRSTNNCHRATRNLSRIWALH